MILKLKNKQLLGMSTLLEEAATKGGVPSHFLLSGGEFRDVLVEIKELPEEQKVFKIIVDACREDIFKLSQQIKSNNPRSEQEVNTLVTKWMKQEYCVEYKNIKIKPSEKLIEK